jgi:hypothetical protein
MTFTLMAAIVAYLAIGISGFYFLGKDEFRKIPLIFQNEHILVALGYVIFMAVIVTAGILIWPFPLMLGLFLNADYLMDKYQDR